MDLLRRTIEGKSIRMGRGCCFIYLFTYLLILLSLIYNYVKTIMFTRLPLSPSPPHTGGCCFRWGGGEDSFSVGSWHWAGVCINGTGKEGCGGSGRLYVQVSAGKYRAGCEQVYVINDDQGTWVSSDDWRKQALTCDRNVPVGFPGEDGQQIQLLGTGLISSLLWYIYYPQLYWKDTKILYSHSSS